MVQETGMTSEPTPGQPAHDALSGTFLRATALDEASDVDLPPVSEDPAIDSDVTSTESIPRVEGYHLIERLGQGGMGVVWRARQLSTNRDVAIKFLAGGMFGSESARRRFQSEVELAGQLQHPHIARLYHSGVHRGAYFYAMEYVDGVPLDVYVRNHNLGREQILQLMRVICQAVDYAHQRGVIHRDLKPSNILVDTAGEPRLLDFGLARTQIHHDQRDNSTLSIDGEAVGTLAYMAPEQAAGQRQLIDTRADVYSLGVILFQLLTDSLPRPLTGSRYEQQRQVIEQEPMRLRDADPTADRELDALLTKALAQDTPYRYATAGELAHDLDCYLKHEPLQARPLTLVYFIRKRIRKYRGRFAVAIAIALASVLLLAYTHVQVRIQRDRAVQSEQAAQHSLYLANISAARHALDAGDPAGARAALKVCPVPFRHWAWHRLRYQTDQSLIALKEHNARVVSLGLQGSHIISVDRLGHIYKSSSADGSVVASYKVTGEAHLHAMDANAQIAAFGTRHQIDLYTLADGQHLTQLDPPVQPLRHLAIDPTGRRVAALAGNAVMIWNHAQSGGSSRRYEVSKSARHLWYGSQGQLLWAVDRELWLLAAAAERPRRIGTASNLIRHVALTLDGEILALAEGLRKISVWQINGSKADQQFSIDLHTTVTSLAFSSDRRYLAVGLNSGEFRLFSVRSGESAGVYRGHTAEITALQFMADGKRVVSGSSDETVRIWRIGRSAEGRAIHALEASPGGPYPIPALALSPRGEGIAAGDMHGDLYLSKNARSRPIRAQKLDHPISALAFDPTGRQLAAAFGNSLRIWRVGDALQPLHQSQTDQALRDVVWITSNRLATASYPQANEAGLTIWGHGPEGWRRTRRVRGTRSVATTQDGRTLATISPNEKALLLYDTATWETPIRLPSKDLLVRDITLSPDGRYAAALVAGYRVEMWRLADQVRTLSFQVAGGQVVHEIAFSLDGNRLLTAGEDVKLWDPTTGTHLLTLTLPQARNFFDVTFAGPDNDIVASSEGSLVRWRARSEDAGR